MKTIAFFYLLISLSFSLSAHSKGTSDTSLKPEQSMPIHKVLESKDQLKEKKIQVTGTITKVCPMAGCWVDIQDPDFPKDPKKSIHVKVKDGKIVFPKNSVGKKVTIKGVLKEKKLSKRKARAHFRHRAKELGIPFDSESVKGPTTIWEVKGTSALLEN